MSPFWQAMAAKQQAPGMGMGGQGMRPLPGLASQQSAGQQMPGQPSPMIRQGTPMARPGTGGGMPMRQASPMMGGGMPQMGGMMGQQATGQQMQQPQQDPNQLAALLARYRAMQGGM